MLQGWVDVGKVFWDLWVKASRELQCFICDIPGSSALECLIYHHYSAVYFYGVSFVHCVTKSIREQMNHNQKGKWRLYRRDLKRGTDQGLRGLEPLNLVIKSATA